MSHLLYSAGTEHPLYVGTSGWTYDDWQGIFYPPTITGTRRLPYYAERYNALEINMSFYRFPSQPALNAWNRALAHGTAVCLKGSRRVTHRKEWFDLEVAQAFLERIRALSPLQVVLWQLPPFARLDLGRLQKFLDFLERSKFRARHAFEFRHESWWHKDVVTAMTKARTCMVTVSHPMLPDRIIPTSDFLYVRFHGCGKQLYHYNYSAHELDAWAKRLEPYRETHDQYIFFNNDYNAHALHNASWLNARLQRRGCNESETRKLRRRS